MTTVLAKRDFYGVIAQFEQLGLSEREARTYIESLAIGPVTIQMLAGRLGINRTTIHLVVEQLIRAGLMSQTRRGRKRLVMAEDPSSLDALVEERMQELKAVQARLEPVKKILSSIEPPGGSVPRVELYQDSEGFRKMLNRIYEAKTEFVSIINVDQFASIVGERQLLQFFKKRSELGIYSRLIFRPGNLARLIHSRAKQYKVRIKFLPVDIGWQVAFNSWNEIVTINSLTRGRLTSTLIENEDIAQFYRDLLFEIVWQVAEPVRV